MTEITNTGESEIRREVAELLRAGPRHGVGRLVADSRRERDVPDERRLETIIRALCAENSAWIGEFRKRTKKRSKCPPQLRVVVQRCLSTLREVDVEHARLTPGDVLRRMRSALSQGTLTVKHRDELGFGEAYRFFLANLHTLSRKPTPMDLSVRIECEPAYVHGLAILAAWCERNASRVTLSADIPHVQRYLEATGFSKVVEDQLTIESPLYDGEHHVALTRVDREDQQAADQVAGRLVALFDRSIDLDRAKKSALTIMFAELVENVYRHARSNYGTFVMAQAFPRTRKLHVVVADTGIGVYASFRESDSLDIREQASGEEKAIDMALAKRVTSKTDRHAGYGLFLVRRLINRNRGFMRLTSGRITKEFRPKGTRWKRGQHPEEITEHLPWNGTEVSLIFNLDAPFPLREIYEELGPPDRAEDFFD